MSKELEALKKFLDDYLTLCEKLHTNRQEKMLLDKNSPYNVLKTYLEAIDNSNPSEALECLEDIYRNAVFISDYDVFGKQHTTNISPETNKSISVQCDIIKQALLKAQEPKQYVDELKLVEKKLKALEIIKEKRVDIFRIKYYITSNKINELEEYKRDRKLTEKEFNLLKEVL